MTRSDLVAMARRTLAHARAGTVPLADEITRVPVAHYCDRDRWALELARIFRRLPLVLGLSCELSRPTDYKAVEVAGVPVLITRTGNGSIKAFVNVCSHRGAIVVAEGAGRARRFTCPYHGWSYDGDGRLVGVLDRAEFGELDLACHGLTPLPVAERSGLIFVTIGPGGDVDIDAYLCGYGDLLDQLGLADCRHVGSQRVDGPNWKVAYDGYLDFYHLPVLHRNSFGPDVSNKAIYDAWGPHQRVSSPDRRVLRLDRLPENDWPNELLTDGVWTLFPHASIAGFAVEGPSGNGGRLFMVSTLFPGPDPTTSTTVQHFLADFEPCHELEPLVATQRQFLLRVVRDEDYATGHRIQRGAATGAKTHFLFGRNEAGGQRFHRWVDELVAAESIEAVARLFAGAEVIHQP